MSDYQELIKNFERIRDYMRQFFIYGFKVRNEYSAKSARTYDNERRRIESMLADYTRSEYTSKGRQVYITVDSKSIPQNPLYTAWKSKSFTDNDITLHFYLTSLLADHPEGITAGKAADEVSALSGSAFDNQTVRLKLKEYEAKGIFRSRRQGRELKYLPVTPLPQDNPGQSPVYTTMWAHIMQAVSFYQGAAPFGFVGSTLLDRSFSHNRYFQFKHQFLVHTLEDGVLYHLLEAMSGQCAVSFENKSYRSGLISHQEGVPLKIFVSTQTGRRYLCMYLAHKRRFHNYRIDSISGVKRLEAVPEYNDLLLKLERNLPRCYGVSFGGHTRQEEIQLRVYVDEKKEPYILDRLYREARGGEVMRIRENEYLYSGYFYDTNELLSWVKTFTGRILDIQGSNRPCIERVVTDWEKMYQMYCCSEDDCNAREERGTHGNF